MANVKPVDWSKAGPLIDELRSPEGASVALCCDNPDFNGLPDCAIYISDDWTDYEAHRFSADSVVECLEAALQARSEANG